jgi:hypothetical protein
MLVWVDREGHEVPLKAPARAYFYPRLSPDGTRVALDIRDQENDLWMWDLARETLTRLTFGSAYEFYAGLDTQWTGRDLQFRRACRLGRFAQPAPASGGWDGNRRAVDARQSRAEASVRGYARR